MAHGYFANLRREGEFFEVGADDVREYFMRHITALYNEELMEYINVFK